MAVRTGGDLRRMRDRDGLHPAGEPREPHTDGIGDRPAHTGIDFVEDQGRRRATVRQHHFQRQEEARELAAGGDFHHRARPGAGIGLRPEFHPVDAVRPGRGGIGLHLGGEGRAFELERRDLGIDGLVERQRGLVARGGELLRGLAIVGVGLRRRLFELRKLLGAGIDQSEVGGIFLRQRGEAVDRGIVFAPRGAQRKQPLLDPLQFGRIVIRRLQRGFEMRARFLDRIERSIERLHRRLDQHRRLRLPALEPADRSGENRHRRRIARHRFMRVFQITRDFLRRHHAGALVGERGFLALLRREL